MKTEARRVDAGTLEFGGGLEVLLSASLEGTPAGEMVDIVTPSRSVALEIPGWARTAGNEAAEEWKENSGTGPRYVVRVRRGASSRVLAPALPPRGTPPRIRSGGSLHTADLLAAADGSVPDTADPSFGLVPLGAIA